MRWGAPAVVASAAETAFLVLWAVAEALPGQSPRQVTVSGLVLGRMPWIITLAFLAHAVCLAALALRLRALAWPAVAAATAALGMLLVATFPVGPGSNTVHVVGAWLAFGGVALSAGTAAAAATPVVRWLGVVVVAGTAALLASGPAGWFPVFERVQLLLNGAWIFTAAAPRAFSTPAKSPRA